MTSIARWTPPTSARRYGRCMHRLAAWRLELFVVVLAVLETVSVAVADVGHKTATVIVTLVSALVLLGCRWQPLAATVTAFSALTVSLAVQPTSTTAQFFGTLATFAIAGAVNREREAVVAWAAGAAMLGYAAWVDPFGGGAADFLLSLAFGTTMWGAGLVVARRGRHVQSSQEQARLAAAQHADATALAVAEERAAIARELHDVVSHGLSIVVVQTAAARGALHDRHGVETREVDRHLHAVEETARDALGEMRRMLGLLQPAADEATSAMPAPGIGAIEDLVERVMAGQGQASLTVRCDGDLPPGLELTVYRLVQEALTNVVKHAPGARVDVSLTRHANALHTVVVNGPARLAPDRSTTGGGRGLVGVRERVSLYGGEVVAQARPDGGFELSATLPLHANVGVQGTASTGLPIGTA